MKSRIVCYIVILSFIGLGLFMMRGYLISPWESSRVSAARSAIDQVVDACTLNDRTVYAEAVLKADDAIGKLDYDDEVLEETTLENQLILAGCRP